MQIGIHKRDVNLLFTSLVPGTKIMLVPGFHHADMIVSSHLESALWEG